MALGARPLGLQAANITTIVIKKSMQRAVLSQKVVRVAYAIMTEMEAAAILVRVVQQLGMEEGVDAAITVEVEVGMGAPAVVGLRMQVASSTPTRRAHRVATAM